MKEEDEIIEERLKQLESRYAAPESCLACAANAARLEAAVDMRRIWARRHVTTVNGRITQFHLCREDGEKLDKLAARIKEE